jgi:selenocysteine lyase/cysteine desulfurase
MTLVLDRPLGAARRADFAPMSRIHLDAAYMHPMSLGARAALDRYAEYRMGSTSGAGHDDGAIREQVQRMFATLIGAKPTEIAFVPSTMAGENAVLSALGLSAGKGRVVTDALHFTGSLYLYQRLAAHDLDVQAVPARDGRIELEDLAAALETPTDLVALSSVSNYNGFRHDLEAVCELAHARGALVYADIIQAAGAVPFNVKASGVDFCACATYKWLMGDFGVGFLYVRADRLDRLDPTAFGYRQVSEMIAQPEADPPVLWRARLDATGAFGMGTMASAAVAQLYHSLDDLLRIGVEDLARHREGLLLVLRERLSERGCRILTPRDAGSPILAFAPPGLDTVGARLEAAGVFASVYDDRVRVAPTLFNDFDDIDALATALFE